MPDPDPDADPGGPKTIGSYGCRSGSGCGSATLFQRNWGRGGIGERMLGRRQVESGKDDLELKKAGRTGGQDIGKR